MVNSGTEFIDEKKKSKEIRMNDENNNENKFVDFKDYATPLITCGSDNSEDEYTFDRKSDYDKDEYSGLDYDEDEYSESCRNRCKVYLNEETDDEYDHVSELKYYKEKNSKSIVKKKENPEKKEEGKREEPDYGVEVIENVDGQIQKRIVYRDEDKNLYSKFLQGDTESFNDLIRKYRDEIVKFIYKLVSDFYAAEDISQEVFVYILQHKTVYNFRYAFRTYIYTIARTRAANHRVDPRKLVFIEDNEDKIYYEIGNIEEDALKEDDTAPVIRAMKKLPKVYQTLLHLVDVKGFSYYDAGIVVGKTENQVRSALYHARHRLKVLLEKELSKDSKGGRKR